MNDVTISIVSPVYKAEKIIDELVKRIVDSVSKITGEFEIILVEDGSPDSSWSVIERNCKRDNRIKGIKLSRNFGQHHATTAGLDCSSGSWVVILDCDLQDLPEEIPKLYIKAQEGYDVVLARRVERKHGWIKQLTSQVFYKVFNFLTDMNYDGQVGGFKIFSRKVVDNLKLMREQHRFVNGLVEWMGLSTASVDVKHGERYEGKSTFTYKKLFGLAVDIITSYSDKPLRIATGFGLTLSFISFLYGAYILVRGVLVGSPVQGWISLMVSLYFLSGIIITILGIVGIYIGKTFSEVKRRPLYVVSEVLGLNDLIDSVSDSTQLYARSTIQ